MLGGHAADLAAATGPAGERRSAVVEPSSPGGSAIIDRPSWGTVLHHSSVGGSGWWWLVEVVGGGLVGLGCVAGCDCIK